MVDTARWLSNQRLDMTYSSFEEMVNKVICELLNVHRLLNVYQMIIDFGCKVKYDVLSMCLRLKDKYAAKAGYQGRE